MSLTREQVDALLQPIAGARVKKKDGMSHVEAYDVRRRLTNIFGFGGWSEELTDLTMLYEQSKVEKEGADPKWRASYRATVKITIHATGAVYEESATGANWGWNPDSKRDEAHDFAIKMAVSQAVKRCAVNLGDQFGASLYNAGSLAPLVKYVLGVDPAMVTPEHDGKAFVVKRPEKGEPPKNVPPPAQAGAPSEPAPDLEVDPDTPTPLPQDMIRDEVEAILGDDNRDKQAKKAALGKVLLRVQREKLRSAVVTHNGSAMSLDALIQKAMGGVGR